MYLEIFLKTILPTDSAEEPENEVGGEALSTTLNSDLAPASADCNPTASRHPHHLQRTVRFMLTGWLDAAMGV